MTSRDSCDVLIVGGGPAGSSCARQLRRAGLDVLILDKSQFPRDKVCAGWITPQVVEELQIDTRDYEQGRVLQPITSFITGMGERAAKPVRAAPVWHPACLPAGETPSKESQPWPSESRPSVS